MEKTMVTSVVSEGVRPLFPTGNPKSPGLYANCGYFSAAARYVLRTGT